MNNIRFGVNFIPSKNWLHSWVNWDSKAIEEDLIATKELGADHIRAHLLWSYFQIDPYVMSPVCMKNLEDFRRICEKVNIDFCLSLFTGFMSGLFFLPAWNRKLSGAYLEGIFHNPEMIKAEEYYVRQIAKVVADSPNFIGFDLGNELSCIVNNDKTTTISQCDEWNNRMMALCEELAPGKLHNNGVDHKPWFMGRGFSRETLANTGAITPVHCYSVFTGALRRFGRMSEESVHLAPFMIEMAKAFSNNPDRKYWVQEFGTASDVYDDEMNEFVIKSIEAMYTSENLWGISWWCTHNIARNYSSFDDIEYELGLLDINNKPMPAGRMFKEVVAKYKSGNIVAPKRDTAFNMQPLDKDGNLTSDIIWEAGKRYGDCIREGIYPAIILPGYENDMEYLKKRGIKKII